MNSHIQIEFQNEGWIQVESIFHNNIPVFFRFEHPNDPYPFQVIKCTDRHAYYRLYDEWISKGMLPPSGLTGVIPGLVAAAFDHYRSTTTVLQETIYLALTDYYWTHNEFYYSEYYRDLADKLYKKRKDAKRNSDSLHG